MASKNLLSYMVGPPQSRNSANVGNSYSGSPSKAQQLLQKATAPGAKQAKPKPKPKAVKTSSGRTMLSSVKAPGPTTQSTANDFSHMLAGLPPDQQQAIVQQYRAFDVPGGGLMLNIGGMDQYLPGGIPESTYYDPSLPGVAQLPPPTMAAPRKPPAAVYEPMLEAPAYQSPPEYTPQVMARAKNIYPNARGPMSLADVFASGGRFIR